MGAISLGAAAALLLEQLGLPTGVTVALVVAAGVLLAGWSALGTSGSWVPTAALLTLVIGGTDPVGYVGAYAGLTLLGALVGLAVTAAFPPLQLAPAQVQLGRLRDTLAGQLDDLAGGLRLDTPPDEAGWRTRMRAIDPVLSQMREAVRLADRARRGNRRARRHAGDADRQYEHARALESLAFLVEDLTELVREHETAGTTWDEIALGPRLRPATADALAALAAVLRSVEDDAVGEPEAVRAAFGAVRELAVRVRAERAESDHDLFVAGSVLTTLRRSLRAVVPRELAEEEAP